MIIKHCLICQTPIKVSPSQLASKKTCSKRCDYQWRKESGIYAGANNPAYIGGKAIYRHTGGQYYCILRGKGKKVYEHRYIMEQHLGRKLNSWEEIHHINGDTLDNRIENLVILPKQTHSRNQFHLSKYVQQLEMENRLLKEKLALLSP